MAQKYSLQQEKIKERFAAIVGDDNAAFASGIVNDTPQGYSEQQNKIKKQFAAIVGGNCSFTPAIVKTVNGRKCEVYFAYNISKKKILRPYLKLVTDFKSGLILEFTNAYYSDFANAKKYPLNAEFDAKVPVAQTVKEQTELLKNLQKLYVKIRTFALDKNLSADNKQTLADYENCLSKTLPADLLNFCKDTEPDFFNWITSNI